MQEEGLANELAGEFYLARGQKSVAKTHMRDAQRCYHRWGATAKVRDLVTRYPQWFQEREGDQAKSMALINATMSVTTVNTSGILDFATAMKASQVLSQEIVLENLLRRLLQVTIENAGAQRGVLLLRKDRRWFIEAEKADDDTIVLQSIPLDEDGAAPMRLPVSLVYYVARTRESMVIHEARKEKMLSADPYVQQHQLRSILCLPILHQAEVTGMLYLENNAVAGAFTQHRLEILQLLASQAAISIENARLYADMEQRVAARTAELEAISLRDALTGVANRKALDQRLKEELGRVQRSGQPLSLLMFDIDHFKRVNDSFGHLVGDQCLQRMGALLIEQTHRSSDFVARYGGEEFMMLLPGTDLAGAVVIAESMLRAITTIVLEVGAVRHPITASIGVATATCAAALDAATLIACADRRLYAAKENGRNRVVSEDPVMAAD